MTKGFIRYILFLLIIVMLMILYDSYALFVVFASFVVGAVISFIIWYIASKRIVVTVQADKPIAVKGEKISVCFGTDNRTPVPLPGMSVKYLLYNAYSGVKREEELEMQGAPFGRDKAVLTVGSEFCGNVCVEPESAYIFDIFRIFKFKVRTGSGVVVAVLPAQDEGQAAEDTPTVRMKEGSEYSGQRSGDDVSEIFDIREYRPGDSFKRVHRNLSNKMDQLLVKEFGLPLDRDLKIFADFTMRASDRETLEAFDAIICDLAGKGEALTEAGVPFCAIWYDSPCGCVRKVRIDSRDGLFDVLAQMYVNSPSDPEPGIVREYEAAFPLDEKDEAHIMAGEAVIGAN